MGYVPHAERVMTVCLSTVGAFHRFKLGKQHTPCLLNEDICSWNPSSWRWASQSVLSLIAGFSGLVCEADYTSNIQKTWQRIKPYTWRQTIKGLKFTRFMLFFQAKPLAKTVRTSVNNIRPIPHRKQVLFTIKHTLSTHNDTTAPTGRKAPQRQQVIHLKLLVLVTIKPRGFVVRKKYSQSN